MFEVQVFDFVTLAYALEEKALNIVHTLFFATLNQILPNAQKFMTLEKNERERKLKHDHKKKTAKAIETKTCSHKKCFN